MFVIAAVATMLAAATAAPVDTQPHPPVGTRITGAAPLQAFLKRVPSFSRQTHMACNACHAGFPQLTPFGRLFKLNGYTLTGLQPIVAQQDTASRLQLQLEPIAPLSVMAIIAETKTATALPDAQSLNAQMPQELSLFAAAGITPKMGIFSQFTYEDQEGTFGIDNVDIRYADHKQVGSTDVLFGLTLNNNPTVQDVWNTTPAWGYPFTAAGLSPTPGAVTAVEDAFGQSVVGLGAYTLLGSGWYAELTGYVAAPQGTELPLGSDAEDTPHSVSPYWRLAYQHQFASTYLMLGTFGMSSGIYPSGISGELNDYRDVAFDAQVEQKAGTGMVIGRAAYIHESQTLHATHAASESANLDNTLNSYKLNASWIPSDAYSFSAGLFGVTGTTDAVLYPEEDLTGYRAGSPSSRGVTLEATANPWLNVRLGAQYVAYQKFNGGTHSYDLASAGRNASDNNTLYLYLWFAY